MKQLLVYLKDYKKESILAPSFKLLEALFDLFTPILVANIINTGIYIKFSVCSANIRCRNIWHWFIFIVSRYIIL